jgi:hypothetical protein
MLLRATVLLRTAVQVHLEVHSCACRDHIYSLSASTAVLESEANQVDACDAADELARAFKARDVPLPPWRQLQSLISKYDAAQSVDVLGSLPGKPSAPNAQLPTAAVKGGMTEPAAPAFPSKELLVLASRFAVPVAAGEAAAAKKAQEVKLRIARKLAQWGLQPAAELAGASPTSVMLHDWSSDAGTPPTTPPARRAQHTVQIGFQVNERVCWAYHECVCGGQLSKKEARRALRAAKARLALQLPAFAAWRQQAGRSLHAEGQPAACAALAA